MNWDQLPVFGHYMLPCMTAEVSAEPTKGITRLCLPFLANIERFGEVVDVEEAISVLCARTWFLAFALDRSFADTACLRRLPHKMRVKEEEGDLWFNKSCSSSRIATTIQVGSKSMVYMYLGGGTVDQEQSQLLQGIVVNCKSWTWASYVLAAARITGLMCDNPLGPVSVFRSLVQGVHEAETEKTKRFDFRRHCDATWKNLVKKDRH